MVSEEGELGRWQMVTGLGRGLQEEGRLTEDSMTLTLKALGRYGRLMDRYGALGRRAVATSAARDASNRDVFLDRAERVLGVRPQNISGEEEARLSYAGAVTDLSGQGMYMVVDIGGGSTEFVWRSEDSVEGVSLDIGSVRMTESVLPDRPPSRDQIKKAFSETMEVLSTASLPFRPKVVGVAGTWTSLAAIALGLRTYDRTQVHHSRITAAQLAILLGDLAKLTVEETAALPSLEPARAPMILAGGVIAHEALRRLASTEVLISESDLLDGLIATI
jgi:exopolyphosphatase/guanosine-5'-triphosphate,3'-diphosphate pyrophosphatase